MIHFISADTVHCEINEPRQDPGTKWYSVKSNGPGLSYELGISIYKSNLVWIRGPYPAATNDLTIFKAPNGLKSMIPAGKRVIADRSYKDPVCSIRNPRDTPEVKQFKRRARARHEIFNGRLKNFQVLKQKFRHDYKKHVHAFEAVCVLCQYDMEKGNPLFDV